MWRFESFVTAVRNRRSLLLLGALAALVLVLAGAACGGESTGPKARATLAWPTEEGAITVYASPT